MSDNENKLTKKSRFKTTGTLFKKNAFKSEYEKVERFGRFIRIGANVEKEDKKE